MSVTSAREHLRDGSPVEVRALRPEDEADMLAALDQASPQSLQRRFFAMKSHFKERAFFMDVDFKNHIALVARAEEAGRKAVVGGRRYIVSEPGRAEMAFMVVDAWQGRGVGSMLMRHLVDIARETGLKELTAEVLPENTSMTDSPGSMLSMGFCPPPRPHQVSVAGTRAQPITPQARDKLTRGLS
jgi:GNAT superfamily N-acetyltransferase